MRKIIKIKAKNFFAKIQKLILADTHYSKKICFFTNYSYFVKVYTISFNQFS